MTVGNQDLETDIVLRELETFDMDLLSECVKDSHFLYQQISTGQFRGELSEVDLSGFIVNSGRCNQNINVSGEFSEDRVVIGLVLGKQSRGIINSEQFEYGSAFVAKEGLVVDVPIASQLHWMTVQLDRVGLEPFEIDLSDKDLLMCKLPEPVIEQIASAVNTAFNTSKASICIGEGQVICEDILTALGKRMNDYEDSQQTVNLARQIKIVKKAEDYMQQHLHNPVRISEICRMTNTSERVLEYAFNKIYGLSPKRFLTVLRLNKARKLLMASTGYQVNVTSIAMSCGFRHMGRFASEYKAMFGELPSQTLSLKNT